MTASVFRVAKILHSVELFRGLKPEEIELILAAASKRRFSSRSVITHQADSAKQLLLLLKGRARYFLQMPDGKKLILKWITFAEENTGR